MNKFVTVYMNNVPFTLHTHQLALSHSCIYIFYLHVQYFSEGSLGNFYFFTFSDFIIKLPYSWRNFSHPVLNKCMTNAQLICLYVIICFGIEILYKSHVILQEMCKKNKQWTFHAKTMPL
jgi:hypothetical protein